MFASPNSKKWSLLIRDVGKRVNVGSFKTDFDNTRFAPWTRWRKLSIDDDHSGFVEVCSVFKELSKSLEVSKVSKDDDGDIDFIMNRASSLVHDQRHQPFDPHRTVKAAGILIIARRNSRGGYDRFKSSDKRIVFSGEIGPVFDPNEIAHDRNRVYGSIPKYEGHVDTLWLRM